MMDKLQELKALLEEQILLESKKEKMSFLWYSIIEYLKCLYQEKRDGLIVDYKITNIDWIEGHVDVKIIPNQVVEHIKIDSLTIGGT